MTGTAQPQMTGTVQKWEMKDQFLDIVDLEERGALLSNYRLLALLLHVGELFFLLMLLRHLFERETVQTAMDSSKGRGKQKMDQICEGVANMSVESADDGHRELAGLLEEAIHGRGASIVPPGETLGQWEGLTNSLKDREIVWPPMVVIMNTKFEQYDTNKWIGMGNSELLDYFSSYGASKASHSYGPQGHRGMSILIFEGSAIGYMKAKRLHKHFKQQHTDRDAWDCHGVRVNADGIRQLYGFMAEKQDLEFFNQHAQGKSARSKLKYELRSYEETVLSQLHKMQEDNQKLTFLQDRMGKAEKRAKTIEESYEFVSAELRKKDEEIRILRERSRLHHRQSKEEMDYQESFFKNQLQSIHDARDTKQNSFERLLEEELRKVERSSARREVENIVIAKEKERKEFEKERNKLMKIHEEKKDAMKQRHLNMYYEEEVKLEEELDAQLDQLMQKFAPKR